jgi:hypothetical protein
LMKKWAILPDIPSCIFFEFENVMI